MVHEMGASGLGYLALATELLQRARLADAEAGLWEAADLQWWWRTPRRSDAIDQLFWIDDDGPIAAVLLTDWGRTWQCDPILVPGLSAVSRRGVWQRARAAIDVLGLESLEVLVREDDFRLMDLLARAGFAAGDDRSGITWMDADKRPKSLTCLEDSCLSTAPRRRPVRTRCGPGAASKSRLASGSVRYTTRPSTSRFWLMTVRSQATRSSGSTPLTKVGLVEPMRVEDAYQRRGLGRVMLTAGLDRLAKRGARRLKVGYSTDTARRLYVDAGFRVTSTIASYRWRRPATG